MQNGKEYFILTDEGDINKFLGIEIKHLCDKRFELKQPFCRTLGLIDNDWKAETNSKKTPVGKPVLNKDLEGKPRKLKWHDRGSSQHRHLLRCTVAIPLPPNHPTKRSHSNHSS